MDKKSKVVIVACGNYKEEAVFAAVKKGVDALGGLKCFVTPSENILIKPNFLSPSEADKAIVTHPSVILGMMRLLWENGYSNVKYGDSPGHGKSENASKMIGLDIKAEQYGAVHADMSTEVLVKYPEGKVAKEFKFTKGVVEAEAVINLCKMKTHALERITGAVKNCYGFISAHNKAAGHVKYPNPSEFARYLGDIHRCIPPRLHIMDGIIAMEGNGPGSGDPVEMGVLLFSSDPVALDTVYCGLIYVDPRSVPTNVQCEMMGVGTCNWNEIEIVDASNGEELISLEELQKRYGKPDFNVDRNSRMEGKSIISKLGAFMTRHARRPAIDASKCIKCGICVNHCPVEGKAVNFVNGKKNPPKYDYGKCIRCYCCQEMCPQKAIIVKGR